jgi:hypothetical protein
MELAMSAEQEFTPLTDDELMSQGGTALPDKEVASVLDLNADLDLAIDAAAPIDLAVAANANVAAPIDAAASANVLSFGSEAQALADQGVIIEQGITADATAASTQDSTIDQSDDTVGDAETAPEETVDGAAPGGTSTDGSSLEGAVPDVGALPVDPGSALDGDLLNVDVNLAADADIAAPINGAVAANANVAAPIDAAVAANIGSIDSNATAVAQQDAIITQHIDGAATATADQQSDLQQ